MSDEETTSDAFGTLPCAHSEENKTYVIGIDLGATKTALGAVDCRGHIVASHRIETRSEDGPVRLVQRISEAVRVVDRKIAEQGRITAAGICCPGPVDQACGVLADPPNLCKTIHGFSLRDALAETMGMPVILEHDAKASALGEFHYGAGRDESSMVFIVIGTGVGAAIIAGGELYRGPHNGAGEVGHITIDRNGDLCSCGSRGCVETLMSGPWLERRYRQAIHQHGVPILDSEPITGETVSARAVAGDPLAVRILNEAGTALGIAVASLAMILDIDLYVIGSSVARAGELLLGPARRTAPKYCYKSVAPRIRIVATDLWDDGPILGCAWLAWRLVADVAVKNHRE